MGFFGGGPTGHRTGLGFCGGGPTGHRTGLGFETGFLIFKKNLTQLSQFFFPQIWKGDGKRDVKGTGVLCVNRGSVAG